MDTKENVTYQPEIFDVETIEEAKALILTPEDSSTDERWKTETPYLVGMIVEKLGIKQNSVVLDYGCGIGRIALPLIAKTGCWVIGSDISPSMRALASSYCDEGTFCAVSPKMLMFLQRHGVQADAAFCVWTLQHCLKAVEDIARIAKFLKPSGKLLVVNSLGRFIPVNKGRWFDDHLSVPAALMEHFKLIEEGDCDAQFVVPTIQRESFWSVLEKVD